MSHRRRTFTAALVALTLGLSLATTPRGDDVAIAAPAPADVTAWGVPTGGLLPTAIASEFQPGNIISDTVFFDPGTMTVSQVQAFLNTKGAACTAGSPACLKDIRVTTSAKAADAYCAGYVGGRSETAAQLIVGVANSCGINPKVLLVLLEKEQSLVTRTRPTWRSYEAATGYACPDDGTCNPEHAGLFNQVYMAGRAYIRYGDPAYGTAYKAGRTVDILYNPNRACGSSPVYIENQATAGLYAYTPYQPNAAALANLYGTGDACSAYGNRNFWRLFTDWFGSTQGGGFLVRTASNPTVYLISGSMKHPVPTEALLSTYAPLGPVGYVSDAYLSRRTTGRTVDRWVRGPDGAIYYVDSGTRYYAGTCALVADFRGDCGAWTQLTDVQIAMLGAGTNLQQVVRTWSGRMYYVNDGIRHEVADAASLTANGLPTSPSVYMADAGISWLTVGDPLVRNGLVVTNRATGAISLISSTGVNPLPAALVSGTALGSLPRANLDNSSMARFTPGVAISPFVRTTAGTFLLRGSSITQLGDASLAPAGTAVVGAESLAGFTATGAVRAPLFVQPVGDPLRYEIRAGVRHPVRDDAELAALGGTPGAVLAITPNVASQIPIGRDAALTQFDDVRLTHPFAADILWLADRGITTGFPDATFRPTLAVSRGAMAAFLYRVSASPAFTAPATPTFVDVPASHQFFREIEWLASVGVTTGTTRADGTVTFEAGASVSRQAMAAFLYRLAGSPAFTAPATPTFTDVPSASPFFVAVEWLAAKGISTGTTQADGTLVFEPRQPVSRGAMAAFLHRFDLL